MPDNLAEGFVQMEKLIKEQPTILDIDKVMEQLESEYNDIHFRYEVNYEYGYLEGLRKVMEIVKASINSQM